MLSLSLQILEFKNSRICKIRLEVRLKVRLDFLGKLKISLLTTSDASIFLQLVNVFLKHF